MSFFKGAGFVQSGGDVSEAAVQTALAADPEGARDAAGSQKIANIVTDYGAVSGSGVAPAVRTANTAAIQAAIDSGNSIYIPAGTYEIDSALTWDLDQGIMFGDGSRLSIIYQTNPAAHGIDLVPSPEASGVTKFGIIEKLRIEGVGAMSAGSGLRQVTTSTPSMAFIRGRDLYIKGFDFGLVLDRCDNSSFFGCEFNGNNSANVYTSTQTRTISFYNCVNASPTSGVCWLVGAGGNVSLHGCDTGNGDQHALVEGAFSARDSNFETITGDATVTRSQAATVTIASPGVFTAVDHLLQIGDRVSFSTTGALPTGITASTVYQVISVPTSDTFTVGTVYPGVAINTSGSQSGDHTLRAHVNGHIESRNNGVVYLDNITMLGDSSAIPAVYFSGSGTFQNVGVAGFSAAGGKIRRQSPSATGSFMGTASLSSNRQSTSFVLDAAGQFELTGWGIRDVVRTDSGSSAVAGNRGLEQYLAANTLTTNADRVELKKWDGIGYQRALRADIETKTTTGDPTTGHEGRMVINTFDNTFKIYADGGWRTLASGW